MAGRGERFDVVLAMEVVEHVADVPAFVSACCRAVAPGGLLVMATINRTLRSFALAIVGAEYLLGWLPRGTHDWEKFLCPEELCALLKDAGLEIVDVTGLAWGPARGFHLSDNKSLDYFVTAKRAG